MGRISTLGGRLTALILTLLIGACGQDRPPVKGFVLPEGDIAAGQATFVALGCPQCHTVVDTEITQPDDPAYSVRLGGSYMQVKHYGDLLTSIVNPSHRVAPPHRAGDGEDDGPPLSPMPDFTDTLTVAQLIYLVEFLHSKYTELPRYSGRIYYYPP